MVIENLSGNFHLRTEITKVNRGVPLTLTNPWYKDILAKYDHLRGVEIDDVDLKRELPVYLILGTSECAKIKTETVRKMGKPGEPIAELTRFGWTLMSHESEPHLTKMFLTQISKVDYEELCWLDSCAWIRGRSRCRPKPALWMDPYVSWERTTPNEDVSDPDIQSWLWRALLARFMCLD